MRNIVAILCMLLTTVTLAAQERVEGRDTLYRTVPDSLRRTYSHTEAVRLLSIERDTLAARQIWSDILAEDDDYAPAHYYMSMSSRHSDDVSEEHARRAFVADSSNKWYVRNYATHLLSNYDYKGALPVYRRLLSLDKQDISNYYGLAYLYNINQMPYSAISVLDSADMRLGRNAHTSALKQQLLLNTRQYERAIEEGRRYVEELPYDIEAHNNLAHSYETAGQDSMALVTYERALLIDSTDVRTINNLSAYHARHSNTERMLDYDLMLMRSDDMSVDEKLHHLNYYTSDTHFYATYYFRIGSLIQALTLMYPDNRDVVDLYAMHLLAAGEQQQALDYLRRHLDDATVGAADYISVMQLEHFLKQDELLFSDLARALELYPTDFDLLTFAGFVFGDKGDARRAIDTFRRSLAIAKDDEQRSTLWGYIGDVYHEEGNDRRAFAAYDKALAYNPDNVLVLNNYAYFLSLKDRDLERALTMSARAIYLEKDNSSYLDTHAWVLHRLGRNDEAKSFMRQALSLGTQRDANLFMHYGDILWALGEQFLAETYWDKAVDNGYDAEEMERHKEEIMKRK